MFVHSEVPSFAAHVSGEYLYDMDSSRKEEWVTCRVFAVSSYPGEALTLQVVLNDGSLFSYLPLNAFGREASASPAPISADELSWRNCPSGDIAVSIFGFLRDAPMACYFRARDLWLSAEYLFTVDWYRDNEQVHVAWLDNGQLVATPNHKAKFRDGPRSLPPYKKLHETWRVGAPRKDAS